MNAGTPSGGTSGSDKEPAAVCRVCGTAPCLTYAQRKALADAAAIVGALCE